MPLDATARDPSLGNVPLANVLGGPPIKGYAGPLTIGVHRRADGLVALFERRAGVVISATAFDGETARWLIGELAAAIGCRVTLTRD